MKHLIKINKLLVFSIFLKFSFLDSSSFDKSRNIPEASFISPDLYFCTTRSLDSGALRKDIVQKLQELFKLDTFVESGTYLGDTCEVAKKFFSEVHSIELSKQLYIAANKRFQSDQNVFLYHGDSSEVFPKILPYLNNNVLFYLDGHYSGHVTARGKSETPIIQELEAVRDSKIKDAVILIDDIRGFQKSKNPQKIRTLGLGLENYPELNELISVILEINPYYQFCFLGDALLIFSAESDVLISSVLKACSTHRLSQFYPSITGRDIEESLKIISKANKLEKRELDIYYNTYSPFEIEYGYRSYACYWKGLLLINEGKNELGKKLILKATNNEL